MFNLTRFHGVLAPAHRLRALVVPKPDEDETRAPKQLRLFGTGRQPTYRSDGKPRAEPRPRMPWQQLLKRRTPTDEARGHGNAASGCPLPPRILGSLDAGASDSAPTRSSRKPTRPLRVTATAQTYALTAHHHRPSFSGDGNAAKRFGLPRRHQPDAVTPPGVTKPHREPPPTCGTRHSRLR